MSSAENIRVDMTQRLIYLSDRIDSVSISKACFSLLSLISDDDKNEKEKCNFERKPILIYINSYGGNVHDMWSLIDIIEYSETPIHTYCTGYAMSAAFNIFISGHKRFASKHSVFMYHQISSYIKGEYQFMIEEADELKFIQNSIEDFVSKKTKITREMLDEIREKKKDFYIHLDEALELGVVDSVIESNKK